MLTGIIQKLSLISIFGRLQRTGWIAFFVLAWLPFFGVAFLGWEPTLILVAYFLDRLIYLFFYFIIDVVMLKRTKNLDANKLVRNFFVLVVCCYFLLQLGGLVISMSNLFESQNSINELIQISIAIFILYGIQCINALFKLDPYEWKSNFFITGSGSVFIAGSIFLVALIGSVFLVSTIKNSLFANFFGTGYGILIFIFTLLRIVSDLAFFYLLGRKSS